MSENRLTLYPVTFSSLLARSADEHPTQIAQRALVCWNTFLQNGDNTARADFLEGAHWLLSHEIRLDNGAGVWPIFCKLPEYRAPQRCLSALTQGSALSVLTRVHQLTGDATFLQAAQRAVRPFERDILDGGVQASLHEGGLFFEEVAVYPAAHTLSGSILALFGLYDYAAITQEKCIEDLIQRSLFTLHTLFDIFDTGYWTRDDLLSHQLASRSSHSFHTALLAALARLSACEHCTELARRWENYQRRLDSRLRFWLAHGMAACQRHIQAGLRGSLSRSGEKMEEYGCVHVCVPITQFPVPGGMRGVLAGLAQVMDEQWRIVYLTNYRGQDAAPHLEIQTFGRRISHPWQFPGVWLYSLAGLGKLRAFLRQHQACRLILPQDGVFTGAFAALVGKMAGRRVVCMDHGNVTWLDNRALRLERMNVLRTYPWHKRLFARARFVLYWASLPLLARIATRFTDLFLIAGDEVEEIYQKRLGVYTNRILRYAYMVDPSRFPRLDAATRARLRVELALPTEAILITMINRLASEKGMDIALAGIVQALAMIPVEHRTHVKVVIAGDGPLRAQVQSNIQRYGLEEFCLLWGEVKPDDVITLLGISDIFLYSGTRGTNYSMAVLEAMAAGCAVVASTSPRSNARLLADRRGIAVDPGDAGAVAAALADLCSNPEQCQRMGDLAREYVTTYHTAEMLQRVLRRATFFVPSLKTEDEALLENEHGQDTILSVNTPEGSP